MNPKALIVFANRIQAMLFKVEMQGQISDGHWENSMPYGHYKVASSADVAFSDNSNTHGCHGFSPQRKYNFANRDLFEVVGDRMLEMAKEIDPNHTKRDLMRDLKEINRIFKITHFEEYGHPLETSFAKKEVTVIVSNWTKEDGYTYHDQPFPE